MKGPGIRLDLDVRRIWECPRCNKRRKTDGEVVSLVCKCTREGEQMRLIEGRRAVRSFADVIDRVQNVADPAATADSDTVAMPVPETTATDTVVQNPPPEPSQTPENVEEPNESAKENGQGGGIPHAE